MGNMRPGSQQVTPSFSSDLVGVFVLLFVVSSIATLLLCCYCALKACGKRYQRSQNMSSRNLASGGGRPKPKRIVELKEQAVKFSGNMARSCPPSIGRPSSTSSLNPPCNLQSEAKLISSKSALLPQEGSSQKVSTISDVGSPCLQVKIPIKSEAKSCS